jgi:hypothetical protein
MDPVYCLFRFIARLIVFRRAGNKRESTVLRLSTPEFFMKKYLSFVPNFLW